MLSLGQLRELAHLHDISNDTICCKAMILIKAPDSCWGPCLSFYYSILNWYLLGKAIIFRKATNGCWRPRLSLWYFQMILFIIKAANRLWLHDFIVFSNDTFFYLKSHDLKKKKSTNSYLGPHIPLWYSSIFKWCCCEKIHRQLLKNLHTFILFSNDTVFRRAMNNCLKQLWPTVGLGKKMVVLWPPQYSALWLCTTTPRTVLQTLCKVGTVKLTASDIGSYLGNLFFFFFAQH